MGSFLKLGQVPLDDIPPLRCVAAPLSPVHPQEVCRGCTQSHHLCHWWRYYIAQFTIQAPEGHHSLLISMCTLRYWPSSQCLFHWTIHHIHISAIHTTVMGSCAKGLRQVQTDNIHRPSLTHWRSHPITEGHWLGQTGLALGESVLPVSNHLPVLHDFPMHRVEADRMVIPKVLSNFF